MLALNTTSAFKNCLYVFLRVRCIYIYAIFLTEFFKEIVLNA